MSFDLLDGTDGNSMGSAIGKPIQIFRNGECDDGKPVEPSPQRVSVEELQELMLGVGLTLDDSAVGGLITQAGILSGNKGGITLEDLSKLEED